MCPRGISSRARACRAQIAYKSFHRAVKTRFISTAIGPIFAIAEVLYYIYILFIYIYDVYIKLESSAIDKNPHNIKLQYIQVNYCRSATCWG